MACIVLDSDLLIALLRGVERAVEFVEALERRGEELATTVVNLYELYRGALRRGPRHVEAVRELELLLEVLPLDAGAARLAAEEQARLEAEGMPLDVRDLLIAAIAVSRGCRVATCNVRHFSRVRGLGVLDWCRGGSLGEG